MSWLNDNSKAITSLLAITITLVSEWQYWELRIEKKISASLDILKRREGSVFVDARTTVIQKWVMPSKISKTFAESETYDSDLLYAIKEEVKGDADYIRAMLNISLFYHNAASCALDGICDSATLCSSLWAEIQDYQDMHKGYFAHVKSIRDEDVKRFNLTIPEFVAHCQNKISVFVFSRHDQSFKCRVDLRLERRFGYSFGSFCNPQSSVYDKEVDDLSKSRRFGSEPVCARTNRIEWRCPFSP